MKHLKLQAIFLLKMFAYFFNLNNLQIREMGKYIQENGELNQIIQQMTKHTEKKLKMIGKPEDAGNIPRFEKTITSNRKRVQLASHQGIIFYFLKKHMKTVLKIWKISSIYK